MSYTHNGKLPITLKNHPIDPDSQDWVFFSYQDWLRVGESIASHEALVVGGTLIQDSTSLGDMTDEAGITYKNVYGVKFGVTASATSVSVTHRITTATVGAVDLGRTEIDHTAVLNVKTL